MYKNHSLSKKQVNLFKAFGEFIDAIRLFVSTELKEKYGDIWERKYSENLMPNQRDSWNKNLEEGIDPSLLIDFGNLNSFALKQKRSFFYEHFGRESNNLPTIFNQMADARNNLAHYLPFDRDKAEKAYLHMIGIAKKLEMTELEESLRNLKKDSFYELNHIAELETIKTTVEKTNHSISKQRPKIRKVINLILNTTGVQIDKSNTNLSTINANGLYSVEPNLNRVNNIWYLILINTLNKTIYVFNIPSNHHIYNKLYKRDDKDVYRLLFNIDDPEFIEKSTHERFDRFLKVEFKYDNDSLIFN